MKHSFLIIFFFIVLIFETIIELLEIKLGVFILKPILLALLFLYVWLNSSHLKHSNYILLALFFCWLGDICLMFNKFFEVGLGFFLVGHIFYILLWSKFAQKNIKIRLFLFAFGLAFYFAVLFPSLPNFLRIPVFLYIAVLIFMSIKTMEIQPFNKPLVLGGLLFILSDIIISINQFKVPLGGTGSFLIMLTYGLAQYFLVTSYTKIKTFQN